MTPETTTQINQMALQIGIIIGNLQFVEHCPEALAYFEKRGVTLKTLRSLRAQMSSVSSAFYCIPSLADDEGGK